MEVVVVGAVRTAVGKFGGALKDYAAYDLGAIVIKGLLKKLGLKPVRDKSADIFYPSRLSPNMIDLEKKYHDYDGQEIVIDEVIMGNVLQAAQGQNPARQAAIFAGIPKETPSYTVNKVCGSGLKAIALGASSIMTGECKIVIAGGMESMSNAPYALTRARWGYRMFNAELVDLMVFDGIWEKFYGYHMGVTAENIVELYGISREEQDEYAYYSHMKAIKAIDKGLFKEEIIPVKIKVGKNETAIFDTDEHPRRDTSIEKLSKLPPVFKKDGTITAGNACGINDGAAALLLTTPEIADEFGLKPMAKIVAWSSAALDPAYMGLAPVIAIRKVLNKSGLDLDDIDLIEINEAFAAQILAVIRELEIDTRKLNVNGSGIALGHPIGCTGARIATTLLHEMKRRNARYGLAALCIGGGMGIAMIFERY